MLRVLALALFFAACQPAPEPAPDGAETHHQMSHSPYAGQETAAVLGLTAAEVAGFRNGAGLGFARPAELSSYPGPMHVLELADSLDLSPEQRQLAQQYMHAVKTEARRLGADLVDAERQLDALFVSSVADSASVAQAVAQSGALRERIRTAHLHAHLAMRDALTPAQISVYDRLRGYSDGR
ncbi:MAG: periplasmic heavy metal sensor [Bacteroidota bacterium]